MIYFNMEDMVFFSMSDYFFKFNKSCYIYFISLNIIIIYNICINNFIICLSNRIGDVMILMLISWMMNCGSWKMNNDYSMKFIGVLLIIAAMTKMAQIPFSSWLPAAMAAPTPVSALVHSSNLVTAGVYLLFRFNLMLIDMFFF